MEQCKLNGNSVVRLWHWNSSLRDGVVKGTIKRECSSRGLMWEGYIF
jgi:hypothetical protein